MEHFYRFTACMLAAAHIFAAAVSFTAEAAEDPQAVSEERYNKETESNSWEGWPAGPQVYAESAVVMEASTGTVLYDKDMDAQHYPASITKVMTALLALENLDLDEEVTFSHYAVYSIEPGSSSICRDEGEVLTVEECLYGLMLESGNDCANALAEQVSGTTEEFAELMNQRAAELGCKNTHFVNPHGLPDDNHYTTAYDMALITREAIKHEDFRRISSTSHYDLRATNTHDEQLPMNNHHYMISNYKTSRFLDNTVFVGKTGYTSVALNTLVTCATRSGMDLVCVTMKTQGTGERGVPIYTDTANLLNYAGENFQRVNIAENETNFTIGQNELFDTGRSVFASSTPMIEIDKEGYVVLPNGVEFSDASPKLNFVDEEASPVIATLTYTYAGQVVGSTTLTISEDGTQEFDFQKTGEEGDVSSEAAEAEKGAGKAGQETMPEEEAPTLIKINLRVAAIAAVVVLLTLVTVLFIFRLSKDFEVDLNPVRRWKNRRTNRNQGRKRRFW